MLKKSIKVNAILNVMQTVMSVIFPLITFPYASRVLGVDEIGKYNFAQSVVSYFVLIAGLGISTYAIREGARIRDNKNAFNKFSSQIFSINLYSTIFSYILLLFFIFSVDKFKAYTVLIIILSIQMIFVLIGRNWIFSIYEDYLFITVRSIIFQFISMILLFIMVKDAGDVKIYAIVTLINIAGSNIINFICGLKYNRIQVTFHMDLKKHLPAILLIFSTSIGIVIYGSSDITILGFFGKDYNVGLYGVSVKIYEVVKRVVAAVLTVTIPRFAYYIGNNDKEKYNNLFKRMLNILIMIMFPTALGLSLVNKQCILLLAGKEYLEASISLSFLSFALIFNLVAYMIGYCVLIPNRRERTFFIATIVSAAVNIVLNLIFIPIYMQNAAAFTTVVAECVAMLICIYGSRKYIKYEFDKRNIASIIIGCIWVLFVCTLWKYIACEWNSFIYLISAVLFSGIGFGIIQIILKNMVFLEIFNDIRYKFKRY